MADASDIKDRLKEKQDELAQVVAAAPRSKTILEWLRDPGQKAEIEAALPAHIGVDRFVRIVTTTVKESTELLECTTPSLLGACMRAASLGLEPGPLQHCYLLPFWDNSAGGPSVRKVQFVLGYRGMVELAYRSGFVTDIEATTVYEKDEFVAERGLHEKLRHVQCLEEDPGPVRCYYMLARYTNGGHHWQIAPPWLIEKHRGYSKSPNSPAWRDHYDPMARKTLIRIASPMLRMSYEATVAVQQDERVFNGMREGVIDVDGREPGDPAETDTDTGSQEPAGEPAATGSCGECGEAGGGHREACSQHPS